LASRFIQQSTLYILFYQDELVSEKGRSFITTETHNHADIGFGPDTRYLRQS